MDIEFVGMMCKYFMYDCFVRVIQLTGILPTFYKVSRQHLLHLYLSTDLNYTGEVIDIEQ